MSYGETLRVAFKHICVAMLLVALASGFAAAEAVDWQHGGARWTAERANAWYKAQPYYIGANFVPSTASNELEMWQAETFDAAAIDRELGWAAAAGFNAMRVFLHDLVWKADPKGFEARIDQYLAIADKHGIRTLFVIFDSCWDPKPVLGKQQEPVPFRHNSRWVQSPHIDVLRDTEHYEANLKPYVVGVVSRFKDDRRVLGWDVLNEPGNFNGDYEKDLWTPREKEAAHVKLLGQAFAWAREAGPSQPLTAGVWQGVGLHDTVTPLQKLMLEESDVVTFHSYDKLPNMKKAVEWLRASGRPVICTEYMSRGSGSTFETILPYLQEQRVGAINWGLVSGRSQTIFPWDSWKKQYTEEPKLWFHDVFRKDGTPYDAKEIAVIQQAAKDGAAAKK